MGAGDDAASAVYAEQVRSLFRQIPIALSVNIVNSALVAIVLTPLATRPYLLPWFASVTLVAIGRGILWLRYRRAPVQPENTRRWSRLATCGSLLSGLCWGIGGVILFPVLPASGQLFLIIVMGGMSAGAMAISASHLPSLLAFLLPTSLPMALRFFAQGSATESVLAAMIVVFAAALSLAGRHFSQIFAEALRLRFELNEVNLRLREANLRLQAEIAEHRATEAALHQAQKLEAMGHLTGGIAHDFNNLLTVVVGNATLLSDHAADEPTRRRAAAILGIADRGERLIRQLLTFSRRRTLRPEAVGLQGRAPEIEELLHRSMREDIAVTIDLPADLWPVTVDPGEFELALLNIAVNAHDAMPNGGAFSLVGAQYALPRRDRQRRPRRRVCRDHADGHRDGHAGRGDGAGLRTLFHDQACRSRIGARPVPGLWLCLPERWQRGAWQRVGRGDGNHTFSASRRRSPGYGQ